MLSCVLISQSIVLQFFTKWEKPWIKLKSTANMWSKESGQHLPVRMTIEYKRCRNGSSTWFSSVQHLGIYFCFVILDCVTIEYKREGKVYRLNRLDWLIYFSNSSSRICPHPTAEYKVPIGTPGLLDCMTIEYIGSVGSEQTKCTDLGLCRQQCTPFLCFHRYQQQIRRKSCSVCSVCGSVRWTHAFWGEGFWNLRIE